MPSAPSNDEHDLVPRIRAGEERAFEALWIVYHPRLIAFAQRYLRSKAITPVIRNPATGQSLTGAQLMYAVKPGDEARLGVFTGFVRIRDVFNAEVVHISLSPAAALNQIVPYVGDGTVWVYANLNAYGTLLRDSVLYTLSYPYAGSVRVTKSNLAVLTTINSGVAIAAADNPGVTLTPGATVTFSNGVSATDPLTVAFTFDNPSAATAAALASAVGGSSGNITTLTGGQSSMRKFLASGTYRWTWVTAGGSAPWSGQSASGVIVVK